MAIFTSTANGFSTARMRRIALKMVRHPRNSIHNIQKEVQKSEIESGTKPPILVLGLLLTHLKLYTSFGVVYAASNASDNIMQV